MIRKERITALPSLQESSLLRYISFAALYFAQGIPDGFIFYAIPAWLALNGVGVVEIGSFVAISILPWTLKLINGPVMDRFSFLKMGRRRPWVLGAQAGIVLSLFFTSFLTDPLSNLPLLMLCGFVINFFTAFQDVATDGMAIDIVPLNQQARANGIMWGAKTLGISASVAAGNFLIHTISFSSTMILFSFSIIILMLIPLLIRERKGERILPWSRGEASEETKLLQLESWKDIFRSLLKVFVLPVSLFMGIAAFSSSVGKGFIDVLIPILTVQELGWADTQYSNIFAISNLAAGAGGMIIGGYLIDKFGKKRMMSIIAGLLGFLILVMSIFSGLWHIDYIVIAFILIFYILYVFQTIAVFAAAMNLCWKKISATQFTLYMTISNLGLSAGSALVGPLKNFFTYDQMLLFFILTAAGVILFLRFVNFEKHLVRLAVLESNDQQEKTGIIIPAPVV
jgi:MFS transporter, PAT family, beta-lactamase induction signal transducer AmpG